MNRRVYVYSGIVLLMIIFAYATFVADGKAVPDKEDFKEEKDRNAFIRDIKAEELKNYTEGGWSFTRSRRTLGCESGHPY